MKTVSLAVVGMALMICMVFSGVLPGTGGAYLIGGSHVLEEGQSVDGRLVVLFAQLDVEPGASLPDGLVAFSSNVSLHGAVGGDVLALESDVRLGAYAWLEGNYHHLDLLNVVVLLPQIHTPKDL